VAVMCGVHGGEGDSATFIGNFVVRAIYHPR
jgi:hypothetical protein